MKLYHQAAFHQILSATNVYFNEFMVGILVGWVPPMLVKLKNDGSLAATDEDLSWMASLHDFGRIFGTLFTALFLDRIGRRYSVVVSSLLFLLAWLVATLTAPSIPLVCSLRLVLGVSNGLSDVVSAIYLAENCSPHIRGAVGSIYPLFFYMGLIFECTLATYLSYRRTALVNCAIALCTLSASFLLTETPYFLVMKGRDEAAARNLAWLRASSQARVKEELEQIQKNIQLEKSKSSLVALVTSPENYKSIATIVIFYTLIMSTGYPAINAYSAILMQSSALVSANEFTILLAALQLAAACVAPFIVEKCHRRTMILDAVLLMGATHACTFALHSSGSGRVPATWLPWLIFASIATYQVAFSLAYPAVFIIRSELIPMSVRATGGSLSVVVHSLVSSAVVRLFSPLAVYGVRYNFLLYLAASMATFLYTYFFLPETRGKSLVDMHSLPKQK